MGWVWGCLGLGTGEMGGGHQLGITALDPTNGTNYDTELGRIGSRAVRPLGKLGPSRIS